MAAPLRRSTRIDGSAGGEPLSCGNQSTYNRVANAGNLHRLSPFQMPFGILHNLTGKSSLTFSIEKCHFITDICIIYFDATSLFHKPCICSCIPRSETADSKDDFQYSEQQASGRLTPAACSISAVLTAASLTQIGRKTIQNTPRRYPTMPDFPLYEIQRYSEFPTHWGTLARGVQHSKR